MAQESPNKVLEDSKESLFAAITATSFEHLLVPINVLRMWSESEVDVIFRPHLATDLEKI